MTLFSYEHKYSLGQVLYETKGNSSEGDASWKNYIITLPTGHYILEFECTIGDPFASAAALDWVKLIECSELQYHDDFTYTLINGSSSAGDFFNTLRLRQDGGRCLGDILKWIFLN